MFKDMETRGEGGGLHAQLNFSVNLDRLLLKSLFKTALGYFCVQTASSL